MNQGRRTIRIDWTSTTIYAVFTAVAFGILIVFVGFVENQLGIISWTILITGLAGGAAIVLTLILRWYSARLLDDATARVAEPLNRLGESFASGSDTPVTRDELRTIRGDLLTLWPEILRVVRIGLSVMFLMGLMVELIALATAAVAYLQAERLEQQNTFLQSQSATQDAAFLSASLSSLKTIAGHRDYIQTLVSDLDKLLSRFDIIDSVVSDSADGVTMKNMIADVCPSNEELSCNDMAVDAILDLIHNDGNLRVTDKNAAALRGYYRLSRTAKTVTALFTLDPKRSINEGNRLLAEATFTCSTDPEGSLRDLWGHVIGMGSAAIDMWPIDSPSQIVSSEVMHFSKETANFLRFFNAIGVVDTMLNGDER